ASAAHPRQRHRARSSEHAHALARDHERGVAAEGARHSRTADWRTGGDRRHRAVSGFRPRAVLLWTDAQSQWRRLDGMKATGSAAPAVAALLASGLFGGLTWWPLKYFGEQGLSGLALTVVAYGSVGVVGLPLLWLQRDAWRPQAGMLALVCLLGGTANVCFV